MPRVIAETPAPSPTTPTTPEPNDLPGFAGRDVVRAERAPRGLAPYLLTWAPGAYHATDSGVYPSVSQERLEHGVNGVRRRKDGTYEVSALQELAAQAGKVSIPITAENTRRAIPGADAWVYPWERVSGGAVIHDPRAWETYLAGLMESGRIPRPNRRDLEILAEKLSRLIDEQPANTRERLARRLEMVSGMLASAPEVE